MTSEERKGLLYVMLAVGMLSTSPVLIVWAEPMHPVVKTWGRMMVAALAVGLTAHFFKSDGSVSEQAQVETPPRVGTTPRFLLYGLVAALHFLFYIASLSFTTAAHALSIVYTAPIFVTLLSAMLLKEPVRLRQWAGVGVAVLGVAILAGLEPQMTWGMALGDFMALMSAITFGFYSIAGRYERDRVPLLTYAYRVYGVAALWLLPAALITIPYMPSQAWGWAQVAAVVALGVGPLALGHTLYNASLRRVHATYVNIIASQEVLGGIILSWLLLAQVPNATSLLGALVTLVGIGLVLRG
jgi:drug/metabolite transporter (DMT)-like permease